MTLFQLPEPKVREKAPKNRKLRCDFCRRPTWIGDLCVSLGWAVCQVEDTGCLLVPAWVLTSQEPCPGEGPYELTKNAQRVREYEEAQ